MTVGRTEAAADPKAIGHHGHTLQFQDVLKAVKNGKQPLVDGPEGRKAVELILAIYQSAETGKPVPGATVGYPGRFSTTEDLEPHCRPMVAYPVGKDGSFRIAVPTTDVSAWRTPRLNAK